MLAEAHRIIDTARARGVTLRLLGGLAVREHCRETAFCERPYRDIDLVGPRERREGRDGGAREGWAGTRTARWRWPPWAASGSSSGTAGTWRLAAALHDDDRIDLYLDAFRLHHSIDLRRRLELEPYTVSTSDVLLVKLQRTEVNEDDLRDILTVVKDAAELGDDERPVP